VSEYIRCSFDRCVKTSDRTYLFQRFAGDGKGMLHAKSGNARIASAPQRFELEKARPDDVALFLHTSGTTSRPKGVYAVMSSVSVVKLCARPLLKMMYCKWLCSLSSGLYSALHALGAC
jgi:acyl-coenzyme A synthetase/AMP-(fatty) acid ligase